jgi:hypothetical protein
MTIISSDDLRTQVEWARNNGKATHQPGGAVRFEHLGKTYLIPAALLVKQDAGPEASVDLSAYVVED